MKKRVNIIDIAILVVLGVSVIYGLYRGFMHTVLSVACCLISFALAMSFGPQLSAIVSGNEGVSSTLATYTDAVARVGDYDLASTPVEQLNDSVLSRVLSSVSLPDSISKILENNLRTRAFSGTGLTTVNDYVSNTVVAVAVNVLCFIAVFAVCYLVLSLLVSLIQHVFRLPLLKQLDWLAGGAFGLVRGAMILYVIFLLLPTTIARPEADGSGFIGWLTRIIYMADTPVTLFPSIHCLDSWLCWRFLVKCKKVPRWYKWVNFVFSLLVCASTVLVKQHVFVDIFAGIAVAELGLLLSRRVWDSLETRKPSGK